METHIPWKWYEPQRRFYKYAAAGDLVWVETGKADDRGVEHPRGPDWIPAHSYGCYYKYEYGDDRTILETLWSYPGPPRGAEADLRSGRWSEWLWSAHYNSYYKLMYGAEDIVLKTTWEPTSTKEAEMLINSARKSVHFVYRQDGYVIKSYHIPIQ
jgi:hypothetical protein